MDKKKRATILPLFVLVLTLGMGCGNTGDNIENKDLSRDTQTVAEKIEIDTETEIKAKVDDTASKQAHTQDLQKLESQYETILNNSTREFIGGHPVDESFLSWIYANYGKHKIEELSNQLSTGITDSNTWHDLTGNTIHVLWLLYCMDTGSASCSLTNTYWKECTSTDKTVLDFTGDVNFAEGWYTTNYLDEQKDGLKSCISAELLAELKAADILLVNNEFTYSTRGEPLAGKAYTFRADPSRVALLQEMGTDIANLANNHVYDYGEDALLDTMTTLSDAGIPYVGAGKNLEEAMQPVYFIANGRKIAIVAATQIERSTNYTKEATEDTPGVLKTLNPDKFVQEIKKAKAQSDYVIVYVHWGTEGQTSFGADQVVLAEAFVEAGADAIIGGHPHYMQGISYVAGVPVFYSMGNFWFSTGTMNTGLAQVEIDRDGILSVRYLPCIQSGLTTTLITDYDTKQNMIAYMTDISKDVAIDPDGYVYDVSAGRNGEVASWIESDMETYEAEEGKRFDTAMNTIGNQGE